MELYTGVPALPNAREVSSVQLLFNRFVHALIGAVVGWPTSGARTVYFVGSK